MLLVYIDIQSQKRLYCLTFYQHDKIPVPKSQRKISHRLTFLSIALRSRSLDFFTPSEKFLLIDFSSNSKSISGIGHSILYSGISPENRTRVSYFDHTLLSKEKFRSIENFFAPPQFSASFGFAIAIDRFDSKI